ncbi:UDP-N-acetylenolpyruvoylglucosamine reductase [Nocardioides sp. Root1257]|uniref:UDP-N-acetylmuramate dehydrogenase n=1 Tax=unclassified Nocardioides TaxID=2615069 RepID=UPI0006FD7C37|nr:MULTISPECIES: UDP-N-acetylmuramate dehydrogenase [unclassified Nocardioides]KQW46892.1 UDP-N-acetylenolpyruvoylglucosamine reductase [Nocardioides sp. Root1257]KRC43639.1 UDP-N-acetylenolpyruvoylglucosamine reductase [Nocardioides sp. Root224]
MTELRERTTLRLGGPAERWVRATTEAELTDALVDADTAGEPVLVLGGGSNLVVADGGFQGTVIEVATTGAEIEADDEPTCGGATVTVAAGESWDDVVALASERGWVGIEALSGIPGSVGATPVQNVGAYGQEVSQTITRVRVWDRTLRGVRTFANADCRFGYRTSRFKQDPSRHVVLSVSFQLRQGDLGAPVAYAELARALGVELGERAPLGDVREAVLGLRRGKGMVLDAADHDTWSAGSFFTNPVVDADAVPEGAPAWPQPDGRVKTSAAWLIDHAGFAKGYGTERVSLSTKHTLALTNRGGARTDDLLALAREVRDGVAERFGIVLVNEPVLVGCEL